MICDMYKNEMLKQQHVAPRFLVEKKAEKLCSSQIGSSTQVRVNIKKCLEAPARFWLKQWSKEDVLMLNNPNQPNPTNPPPNPTQLHEPTSPRHLKSVTSSPVNPEHGNLKTNSEISHLKKSSHGLYIVSKNAQERFQGFFEGETLNFGDAQELGFV